MDQNPNKVSTQSRSDKKSLRQKRDRRRLNLEKKLHQYSKLCGADVCLGIRIRDTGRVFTFSADRSGFWAFLSSKLSSYYPKPIQKSGEDLENAR
ncbi:unnamed protein product [Penicillium camemberti]|uniref:Str. FM013 n=1 Tax=Penicillium camemberti (strain FM 013) TaxID=1429867 RepID=A0A0G4P8F7_PENC3|nr:unnamed protein product [Penicillium camemberti]